MCSRELVPSAKPERYSCIGKKLLFYLQGSWFLSPHCKFHRQRMINGKEMKEQITERTKTAGNGDKMCTSMAISALR